MLKIGVAGVGQFGKNHARILRKSELCELCGIYDKDSKQLQKIAAELQIKAFASYEELLSHVDAVVIVVTTSFHYEMAKTALNKGVHTFIEKPITSELRQAHELIELAEKKGLQIQVGHIERFNPVVMEVAANIKNPMFAECHRIAPFHARAVDVPVILDLMIHDIDLILSFIKSEVKEIRASGAGIMTKSIDIANARLEFENGAVANVTASRISMKSSRKLRFFQKDGYFSLDFQNRKATYISRSKKLYKVLPKLLRGKYDEVDVNDVVDILEVDASGWEKDALTIELESFVRALAAGTNPVVDGHDGMRALKIALEIIEKIK